ncbi:MAG: hypothetical protein OEW15_06370 [Nitrospirota bacterium]|nr:hypothetical protein [Nitrospirota bacterium]
MNAYRALLSAVLLLIAAGCNSGHGPDSLFARQPHSSEPFSECVRCHSSTNSAALDPLVTNGSGTYGRHVKHFSERQIPCERCHSGYMNTATHMNGTLDTGDPTVSLVSLSVVGPSGAWVNDTGPGTGSCAGVACHGNATVNWYGSTWTMPACTTCHSSTFSRELDPAVINGTAPAGRHVKHVTSRAIDCERCHYQYPGQTTHANGQLDTADPSKNLVIFNIVATTGTWTNDTGARTGQCATISCHGADTLSWYGSGTWALPATCTTCHTAAYSTVLDPLLTNGSGVAGKHSKHVGSIGFSCSKCHLNYPSRPSHASGVLDTPDPTVLLVYFDSTNTSGTWTADTGQETGACATTDCHAGETPAWYGTAGVSAPACWLCHVNAMGTRRPVMGASGDFGANAANKSHHVTRGPGNDPLTEQCLVCHDMSIHMGGTVRLRNGDTGATIAYSTASTLEPFCLSCHDASGATSTFITGGTSTAPFNDGSTIGIAPYRASAEISANWSKSFGHKLKGLTCVGNGSVNTGCHGNGHGTANVGLLARNLTLPSTKTTYFTTADESDYDLCFACHAAYGAVSKEAILGMQAGGNYAVDLFNTSGALPAYTIPNIKTRFRDVNLGITGKAYDDLPLFGTYINLHMLHLQTEPDGWKYRGSILSSIVCNSCHEVHGSNTQWGWVHDSMLYDHYAGIGGDQYSLIGAAVTLGSYPTSCAINCHDPGIWGITHGWFQPSQE